MSLSTILVVTGIVLEIAVLARVMLRPHREPASRIAWVAVIVSLPLAGVIAYILFGEVNIGRRRAAKLRAVERAIPPPVPGPAAEMVNLRTDIPQHYEPMFRVGHSISHFEPVAGNSARLLEDSNATIAAMVADIEAAQNHVHVLFYIWLQGIGVLIERLKSGVEGAQLEQGLR